MVGAFPCDARLSVPMKERSTTLRTPQPLEPDNPVLRLFDKIGDPFMYIRVLALFALAFLVLVTPSWAQINCGGDFPTPCSITNSFSPGTTSGTFDFSQGGYGIITLKFDTVLTSFTLTATLDATIDPIPVSEEFPAGTSCVQYATT